jgi:hypothetical protein
MTQTTVTNGMSGLDARNAINGNFTELYGPASTDQYIRRNQQLFRTLIGVTYTSGNWYPADLGLTMSTSTAMSTNQIFFMPLMIYFDVTITDIACEVTTAVASSNFQMAIYTSDATTKRPTGAALANTASLSGATAQTVSYTFGSPVALTAGLYWVAVNSDSALAFRTMAATQAWTAGIIGSSILTNVLSANPRIWFQLAQTFGTWPSVTPAGLTENNTAYRGLVAAFKVQ